MIVKVHCQKFPLNTVLCSFKRACYNNILLLGTAKITVYMYLLKKSWIGKVRFKSFKKRDVYELIFIDNTLRLCSGTFPCTTFTQGNKHRFLHERKKHYSHTCI